MKEKIDRILEEYVIRSWNAIANGYVHLRTRPWKELLHVIRNYEGDLVLDLGCGSGRHIMDLSKRFREVIALDISRRMIEWTKRRCIKYDIYAKVHTIVADGRFPPFRYSCIDFVLSVAVIHNIPSREERIRLLENIKSIMKVKGSILITVWSRYQPRLLFKSILQFLFKRDRTLEFGDVLIPWRRREATYYRYYHLFSKRELREHLTNVGFKIVELNVLGRKCVVIPRNYVVLAEKVC